MTRQNTCNALLLLIPFMLFIAGCGKDKSQEPSPTDTTPPAAEMDKTDTATPPAMQESQAESMAAALPDVVGFTRPALYPEGLEYDPKRNRFLVTSLHEGVIGEVSDDGNYNVLIQNENFVSAIGIRIDHERDRLLVCNSDPGVSVKTDPATQKKIAGFGIFQLSTGNLIKYQNLAEGLEGGHFCNDIALDNDGNAYVTDSFSPIIYKVGVDNNAAVLLNNERFVGEGFNLNGIVYKDDYLLVAKMNEGLIFKVPVNEPDKFTQVNISEAFPGADGLLWAPDGDLVVIANGATNKVVKLTSADNWATAEVVKTSDTGEVFATTGVVRDGQIYVLNAMLHVLFNPETKEHVEVFEIKKHLSEQSDSEPSASEQSASDESEQTASEPSASEPSVSEQNVSVPE